MARNVLFAGSGCHDPICGHEFRRFAAGPRKRPDAHCPNCMSAERHRALWVWLEAELADHPTRLLHVAPEAGIERRLRALPDVDYVTMDQRGQSVMVQADLTALPFPDGSFDMVLCNHVLEHIPDDRRAMAEIRRVLRPGGRAVMQHPIDEGRAETFEDPSVVTPAERDRVFFQFDHVRIYGADFQSRLEEAGFTSIEKIRMATRLDAETVRRFGLEQHPSAEPEKDLEADVIYVTG